MCISSNVVLLYVDDTNPEKYKTSFSCGYVLQKQFCHASMNEYMVLPHF